MVFIGLEKQAIMNILAEAQVKYTTFMSFAFPVRSARKNYKALCVYAFLCWAVICTSAMQILAHQPICAALSTMFCIFVLCFFLFLARLLTFVA